MVTTDNLKSYFEKARRFDLDRMIQLERSARIAWYVAVVASVLAAASTFAVAGLTPLKTVEPFVALALETPGGAPRDNRIRFVDYQPYNITKVVGSLRSSVQIEFAADEEIAHVALGNTVAWEVAPAGNMLFLKPRENQPLTNISVVTTRQDGSTRSYQMELTVRDGPVAAGQDTYFHVKYRYPADEAERRREQAAAQTQAAQASEADRVLALHERYGPRNWRYSAQGSAALEPQVIYDNGKITTFAFSGNQEMPTIYMENSDGTESLLPKSVDGDLVLVHAISRKFILRRGGDVLCIFNEAYDRILLQELRDGSAFYYIRNINSGHPGSITTVHADSARLAFEQLTLLVKESDGGRDLERDDIRSLLKIAIDIIVQCKRINGQFRVSEIYFEPTAQSTRRKDESR